MSRVLVTGAGGPAGVAVIQELMRSGHTVLGGDCDSRAAGLRLASEAHVLPRADGCDFGAAVLAICAGDDVEALISTVAEEVPALQRVGSGLAAVGVGTWLPSAAALDRCLDKLLFDEICRTASVPVPQTALRCRHGVDGPWVVKPRRGRGSRDVVVTDDARLVDLLCDGPAEVLVQQQLPGREFTADVLVERDGSVAGIAARWRSETKAGISTRGTTFVDQTVQDVVRSAVSAVGLTGVCNVQGFVSPTGEANLVEINPRFSGGLPLSQAAGADLVGEYLRGCLGLRVRPERLRARAGVEMTRYWAELFTG